MPRAQIAPRLGRPSAVPTIERFDYSRIGNDWAVLRLLAGFGDEPRAPWAAHLVVDPDGIGEDFVYAAARACGLERRLLTGRRGASELLWRASFALPLDVVRAPEARFHVRAGDSFALALPSPGLRLATPRELVLSPRVRIAPRSSVGVRQRFAALATAVVVTATSTPAVALAAGQIHSTRASRSHSRHPRSGRRAAAVASLTTTSPKSSAPGTGPRPSSRAATLTTTPAGSASTATPAGTVPATATGGAAAVTTTAATTTPPTPAAKTSTAAGSVATSSPSLPSVSSRRVIGVRPRTAAEFRPTAGAPKRVTHLFSDPARTTGHGPAEPARVNPGCHTSPGAGAVAYAAGAPSRSVRIVCPTPTTKPAHHPAATAPPTFPTGKPATHHPAAGRSHPAPTRHSHSGGAAHRGSASSHATGGAPLVAPVTSSPQAPAGTTTGGSVPTLSPSAPGFNGPKSWTGTVSADPALTGAVNDLSGLLSNGNRPPSFLIPIYMQAAQRYRLPWEVLAAINAIESDYGRDLNTSSAGAVGWMQFEPSTWKEYGMAVDGHSMPNPYDPRDAIFAAAHYLAAAGGANDISRAVYAYNHAGWYVDEVMSRAHAIATHAQYERTAVKHGTFSVSFATGVKRHPTISYQGNVLSHYDRLIAAANMVSAANFPYLYGGGHEQPAIFAPFDCSGSVSYVMQQAGYKVPTTVSGDIPIWKFPAGPGQVTIFYNPVHTFMRIGNRYFGTSGFARPGGGAGWFDVNQLPANYLATFREVHVPGLGVNSFAPGQVTIPPPAPKRHSTTVGLKLTLLMSSLGPFPRA